MIEHILMEIKIWLMVSVALANIAGIAWACWACWAMRKLLRGDYQASDDTPLGADPNSAHYNRGYKDGYEAGISCIGGGL